MYVCRKCKSRKINTRVNKSFGKSVMTVIGCRDCGSTDIEKTEVWKERRR